MPPHVPKLSLVLPVLFQLEGDRPMLRVRKPRIIRNNKKWQYCT